MHISGDGITNHNILIIIVWPVFTDIYHLRLIDHSVIETTARNMLGHWSQST